ncbi:MAG: UDP-N-acetylglucosamine 2-epimerase, partial [Actinomycetota bacterium]
MRKVCVVVGSRANYSSIKSAMRAIADHDELELQLVVGASALLDRYGSVENLIEQDGFEANERVFMLIEGETPSTMAKSTGLGLLELPTAFERLQPDVVITVGDRFETMATALAATYMNIPLAHTMGGEVSGNIDESIRHAVTKFAHVHFPASQGAADRIVKLGEDPESVHLVGCPRMDLVAEVLQQGGDGLSELFDTGVGGTFSLDEPFLILSQHPVTTEYGDGKAQIVETLAALQDVGMPAIALWPNADAGSEHIAAGMRQWREHNDDSNVHFFKNLPTSDYIKLMAKTAALVGNSSSAIREGAFIGTPAVNIGPRQEGRDRGSNVIDVGYDRGEIAGA